MMTKIDFDKIVSREGTHAEKYEARKQLFGTSNVEPFWVADMDLSTPPFLVEKIQERLNHHMFGYTTVPDSLYQAISWWWKNEHDVVVENDWVRLSPSVVTSISLAVQSMTDIGDGVVIFSPVYGPFFFATELNKRRVFDIPLLVENTQYEIDFEELEKCFVKDAPTLVMLCSPHNPGGRTWPREDLEKLVALCKQYGVKIFCDEIHCDIVFAPNQHTSLLSIEDAKEISVVAHSIGKTFNTSGLCASFVVVPNPELKKAFVAAQELSHCGNVNIIGKIALEAALSPAGASYKQELVKYIDENICLAVEKLRTIDGAQIMKPQATFLVWCDFRSFGKWPTVMRKLINEADVALSGGTFFGKTGEGYFRLNCAHPRKPLLAAVDRIVETLQQ